VIEKYFLNTANVVLVCALGLFVALGINGGLFDFIQAKRVEKAMEEEISLIELKSEQVKLKLERVNDPKYIEKKIKERFNYVAEGDLVFIFSKNEEDKP
jgi:cell division protein FtsB